MFANLSSFLGVAPASGSVWRRRVALWLAVASGCAAGAAWADPPGRVGRIAETHGTVWMQDDHQGEWVAAARNRPLTQGDRLSLQPGARAIAHIGSATLRLDGDTELEVLQLDDRMVRLHLHAGTAALQLPVNESAREFQVSTPEGRVQPLERAHLRVDRINQVTSVSAWDGALRVDTSEGPLDLARGQKADFWNDRGRSSHAWSAMGRDTFTEWVVATERRDESYASQRHVSPEMTGAYDLARYGVWEQHPQYGSVWYPRTVASDWAPYRDGHWAWVSPWGWTWVDNAPWGFAPFHYGRWTHHHGRWAWVPGSYTARPVYAPALVAWFGGPNLSVSVSTGGRQHPHVGWVPLAPFEVFSPWFTVSSVYLGYVNVSPWRDVRGYQTHRHHDYSNRHVHGGWTVVPQRVLTERRPIRQDVITPQQAAIWRGGLPAGGAVAGAAPTRDGRDNRDGRDVGRTDGRSVPGPSAAFIPPPLAAATVAVPQQAPNSARVVPWVRGSGERVVSTPATTVRDGAVMQPAPAAAPPATQALSLIHI